eukprot:31351-Pelagococcus_subviridis.AAC.12
MSSDVSNARASNASASSICAASRSASSKTLEGVAFVSSFVFFVLFETGVRGATGISIGASAGSGCPAPPPPFLRSDRKCASLFSWTTDATATRVGGRMTSWMLR